MSWFTCTQALLKMEEMRLMPVFTIRTPNLVG